MYYTADEGFQPCRIPLQSVSSLSGRAHGSILALKGYTGIEVKHMSKKKNARKPENAKVTLRTSPAAGAFENQNQNHNTQKESLGPNTKR